jgi:methylthioribulose-1-phosphate dehydratase
VDEGPAAVLAEALGMLEEDEQVNRAASARAAELVRRLCPDRPLRLLTHCNTGGLATVAWGTALGTIRELAAAGRVADVLVDETRPLLQGARLTAWELGRAGLPHRLCVDSAGPAAIGAGLVDCVLVGADRIAANGDVANKIGTYGLAVAAGRAGIPFIVVAPESTVDDTLAGGHEIVIEERAAEEVTAVAGRPTAPAGTAVYNPAFDVTPADLVTAVVTERRVFGGSAGADLAAAARGLYRRGWMDGTAGNLSVRCPGTGELALITASGRSKGELTPADVVLVRTADGTAVHPDGPRPSAETCIHAALYREVPGCAAVVHAHPPYATVVAARAARAGADSVRFAGWELIKGLGVADPSEVAVPVFANHPDVARIGADVARRLAGGPAGDRTPPALLVGQHGATAWGPDLATARNRLECLEALCQLHLLDAGTSSRPDAGPPARELEGTP